MLPICHSRVLLAGIHSGVDNVYWTPDRSTRGWQQLICRPRMLLSGTHICSAGANGPPTEALGGDSYGIVVPVCSLLCRPRTLAENVLELLTAGRKAPNLSFLRVRKLSSPNAPGGNPQEWRRIRGSKAGVKSNRFP